MKTQENQDYQFNMTDGFKMQASQYSSVFNRTTIDSQKFITRSTKNQTKIDRIRDVKKQNLAKLSQISCEISNNVLEYEKFPGPLNQSNIEYALSKGMWSDISQIKQAQRPPGPNIDKLVTKSKTGFQTMGYKLDTLDRQKRTLRTSVKE